MSNRWLDQPRWLVLRIIIVDLRSHSALSVTRLISLARLTMYVWELLAGEFRSCRFTSSEPHRIAISS